ncbi:hypothetical protein GGX14DRAFT_697875 [Mycena pura]|uniref:Peptidase metallopeptidase domain-containing protein n=1 Tax=Mycena pura TaxID=153505 RepID=A0AAD6YB04_9AGAR|nr:hypothetical protein GGX14DRAFT_697875 [Mycena pura]
MPGAALSMGVAPAPSAAMSELTTASPGNLASVARTIATPVIAGTTKGEIAYHGLTMCYVYDMSYQVASNNYAESLEYIVGATGAAASAAAQSITSRLSLFWPCGGNINYSYVGGTANQKAKVDQTISDWYPYANIKFTAVDQGEDVRISFTTSIPGISYSSVGTANQQFTTYTQSTITINLAAISDDTTMTVSQRAIILHEFGHVLGLVHEHATPSTMTNEGLSLVEGIGSVMISEALIPFQATNWSALYATTGISNYAAPDLTSIMKFFTSYKNINPEMYIPPSFDLSDMDKAYMVIVYPRSAPLSSAPTWTLDHALQVFGVDPMSAQAITDAYAQNDFDGGRKIFITFLTNMRLGITQDAPQGTGNINAYPPFNTCIINVPQSAMDAPVNLNTEVAVGAIGAPVSAAAKTISSQLSLLWDSGTTVTYSYVNGTANQKNKVDQLILEWLPYANVNFAPVGQGGTITIAFSQYFVSSGVGTLNRSSLSIPSATMHLNIRDDVSAITEYDRACVLHEFGHILGLVHEHQSGSFTIDPKLLSNSLTLPQPGLEGPMVPWDDTTWTNQYASVYNSTNITNFSTFDPTSIMKFYTTEQYTPRVETLGTIWDQPYDGTNVAPNFALSDMDKAYMVIVYPRAAPLSSAPTWTLESALQVFGVDSVTAQAIEDAYAQGDIASGRTKFLTFLVYTRLGTQVPAAPTLIPADTWCNAILPTNISGVPNIVLHGKALEDLLWLPHEEVTFGFLDATPTLPDSSPTEYRKRRVRKALDLYMQHCSIYFREVDVARLDFTTLAAQQACTIRIAFGRSPQVRMDGSHLWGWSYCGKEAKYLQTKNSPQFATVWIGGQALNSDAELSADPLALEWADAILYHELGHVLGLRHEHADPNPAAQSMTSIPDILVSSLLDPRSIMLYAESPYTSPNEWFKLTWNSKPSPTDTQILRLLYPDNGRRTGMFAQALDAFRFSSADKQRLLEMATKAVGNEANMTPDLVNWMRADISEDLRDKPRLASYNTTCNYANPRC